MHRRKSDLLTLQKDFTHLHKSLMVYCITNPLYQGLAGQICPSLTQPHMDLFCLKTNSIQEFLGGTGG